MTWADVFRRLFGLVRRAPLCCRVCGEPIGPGRAASDFVDALPYIFDHLNASPNCEDVYTVPRCAGEES